MLGRYFRPAYLKAIPDQASLVAVITGDADRRMIIPVLDRLPQHSLGLAINVEVYYSKGCHNSLDHKKRARIEMLIARKRVWTRARWWPGSDRRFRTTKGHKSCMQLFGGSPDEESSMANLH